MKTGFDNKKRLDYSSHYFYYLNSMYVGNNSNWSAVNSLLPSPFLNIITKYFVLDVKVTISLPVIYLLALKPPVAGFLFSSNSYSEYETFAFFPASVKPMNSPPFTSTYVF